MMSLILFYSTWYLIIGLVSAWLINQAIIWGNQTESYTSSEITFAILLWPINVGVFITSLLISLFR